MNVTNVTKYKIKPEHKEAVIQIAKNYFRAENEDFERTGIMDVGSPMSMLFSSLGLLEHWFDPVEKVEIERYMELTGPDVDRIEVRVDKRNQSVTTQYGTIPLATLEELYAKFTGAEPILNYPVSSYKQAITIGCKSVYLSDIKRVIDMLKE